MLPFREPSNRMYENGANWASCADKTKYSWGQQTYMNFQGPGDEEEEEDVEEDWVDELEFKGLVHFFEEYAHPNLPIALNVHASKMPWLGRIVVSCSPEMRDRQDAYWTTGCVSAQNAGQVEMLPATALLESRGYLEQVVAAGLACVYTYGSAERLPTKELPHLTIKGHTSANDLTVCFKFQGVPVCMVMESSARTAPGFPGVHFGVGKA